ncbi:MAG: hypothetical protein N3B21_00980 [Clostridia bacterium]|nr:hypothetical protein [Clostridia bacterium]
MEIDFHHSIVYVLSRLAGFNSNEAGVIAYSSQYVDDAVYDGTVMFANGAIYKPVRSAHKLLDYHYFDELTNHYVWVPFHFLPANCMLPAGEGENEEFAKRVVCKPNSPVAKDMIKECVQRHNEPNALYRLGITLHVYADTWAHQRFSGIQNKSNIVKYFEDDEVSKNLLHKVTHFFKDTFDRELGRFMDDIMPLGHGAVLSYPDKPFLKWRYTNYSGEKIERDNTAEFIEAAKNIYILLKRFRIGDPDVVVAGLDESIIKQITALMVSINDDDCMTRHKKWLEVISRGDFNIALDGKTVPLKDNIEYAAEGAGSWENQAFGGKYNSCTRYEYSEKFMESHWKKFHDALQDHHYYLLRILFPRYGLCIA